MTTKDCDPAFICHFKAMLVDYVDERCIAWPHCSDCEMATSLYPRFNSLACIEGDRREHVWERLSRQAPNQSATPTENTPSKNESTIFSPKEKGKAHLARCRYTCLWKK
ncbi:hypothetical protein HPB48_006096 [Haemaphysalis longicornis]|uniref:Uncharacterized protein n=1 Tax=Haemaphysalis longicornis TaxID=44386 RepID=A0A9J6F6K0_HAELO|nr:hypothetical protein HPB48_006096 [Haemaphysalis longicornis]